METKKVQVYQFDELTGNALENAKKEMMKRQEEYSEWHFWDYGEEFLNNELEYFGLDCTGLEFGLYPAHIKASKVELSEGAVKIVCDLIPDDKKGLLPQGFDPKNIEMTVKNLYACEIEEYGEFELSDDAYEMIEDIAVKYVKEKLYESICGLESNDQWFYSDEFRDELISMNDIVFDKYGNILNNNILEG